jgi:hypothetical protein
MWKPDSDRIASIPLPFGAPIVTRFKELRRIEAAIEHRNEKELRWALEYCTMRIDIAGQVATMKHQRTYWRRIERKVRTALVELDGELE